MTLISRVVYLDGAGIFTGAADFILWIYHHKTCSNGKGTWNIIIKLSYYFEASFKTLVFRAYDFSFA
jgi:hypothetical protein